MMSQGSGQQQQQQTPAMNLAKRDMFNGESTGNGNGAANAAHESGEPTSLASSQGTFEGQTPLLLVSQARVTRRTIRLQDHPFPTPRRPMASSSNTVRLLLRPLHPTTHVVPSSSERRRTTGTLVSMLVFTRVTCNRSASRSTPFGRHHTRTIRSSLRCSTV